MNYVHMLDSEEWMNKNGSWSRRQKEEFLVPYRSYRGAMRAGFMPILERYPLLEGYVDSSPRDQESLRSYEPPIMSFLIQMQQDQAALFISRMDVPAVPVNLLRHGPFFL